MHNIKKYLFVLPALAWFLWSFILTDRSLLFSSSSLFVRFQNFWWQFADQRLLLAGSYIFFVGIFFFTYRFILIWLSKQKHPSIQAMLLPLGIFLLLFTLSNPALSYDLYNYMFDAKLVIQYHLDPHVTSAITFSATDDWVRFMRNTFFPTTYGYMWTVLSLIPFVVGFGKFLLVFISFKLFMLLGLILLFLIQRRMGVNISQAALFFLSPLVMLETLSSGHNDIWMMVLAFLSLLLVFHLEKKMTTQTIGKIILSFVLLFASSEVKRSTALLLPVWGMFVYDAFFGNYRKFIRAYWADCAALLLFLPLFTDLSRQFNPWYLVWSLSFLPFVRARWLKITLVCFSVTSALRYVPILYIGVYSTQLEFMGRIITWSALPLSLLWYLGIMCSKQIHKKI